jgi:hypothetical protein
LGWLQPNVDEFLKEVRVLSLKEKAGLTLTAPIGVVLDWHQEHGKDTDVAFLREVAEGDNL